MLKRQIYTCIAWEIIHYVPMHFGESCICRIGLISKSIAHLLCWMGCCCFWSLHDFFSLTCTSCTMPWLHTVCTIFVFKLFTIKHFGAWADFWISWTMEGRRFLYRLIYIFCCAALFRTKHQQQLNGSECQK